MPAAKLCRESGMPLKRRPVGRSGLGGELMASYATKVRQDITRWQAAGLIDAVTAEALGRDVDANERKSVSFGTILAMMAAMLFAAAILIFVAANWEGIPRLGRVVALFILILVSYVGGALLKTRGHSAYAEAAWLIGAAAFGGSIALIGQMYHMSGDEAGAVVVWCIGTIFAAAALRSGPLTVAAVGLADAWLFMEGFEFFRPTDFPYGFVLFAAVLWLISYWTESRVARHLILLSLIAYVALLATVHDLLGTSVLLAGGSAALLVIAVFLPGPLEALVRVDGRMPLHALIGFLTGIAMFQVDKIDEVGPMVGAAVAALAVIAFALLFAGRESRGLRWIAYLGFAFELCFLYAVTLGSMVGTAGFFLAAGLILAGLAFVIIRIEKRIAAPAATMGAA